MSYAVETVKNRTTANFEFTFDGQVYVIPAESEVVLLKAASEHGRRKSLISYDPITGARVRALVLADSPEAEEIIEGREPGSELLQRDPADGKVIRKTFANPDARTVRISSSLDGED